ncbi:MULTISPECIES: transcription-repair coupling factor [unclassified Aeromicrobium]|uniref:transcription-repair coupling factor n=1 Tax=unclassified Aeromicrobium TaxID=2633570 RepID=UPI0006FA7139|nr:MULTISPECIES: transcription-repair coupling factor [unclassified Aeromicrobium]KQO41929.1 transcription-repair coupling factor [Aeromicrobium sp. Leaf245]KQP27240.1 transcription-repair coupling factor [Aeromicrobium sp. Leaf272]KQP77281.1 transcription-repair coupling factor [Aeromicrobium sp. Leaf289]
MDLHALLSPHLAGSLADVVSQRPRTVTLQGPAALRPFVARAAADASTVLAVTPTAREADELAADLSVLLGDDAVVVYPAWETLPHERLSPRSDTVGRRLAVLRRLAHPGAGAPPVRVVVAPVRSILQPQVAGLADLTPVELVVGQQAPLDDVVRDLAAAAYVRVDLVERRGEFAVRGGIVDVFPPTEDHPLRIDFWGDEVEEIRWFSVADQRTTDAVERLWAPPCRELLLTDEVRGRAAALATEHPALAELFGKVAEGHAVEGMESLAPVLVDELELLVEVLPSDAVVVVNDPEKVRARAADLNATNEEFLQASWAAAATGAAAPIDLGAAAFKELEEVRAVALARGLAWWNLSPFGLDDEDTVVVPAEAAPLYRGDTEQAVADVRGWLADGRFVVVAAPAAGQAQRTVEWLAEHDVPAALVDGDTPAPEAGSGVVAVLVADVDHGLVAAKAVLLTHDDLVAQRAAERPDRSSMPVRRRKQVDPLELKAGDHVVHEQHGVGRYVELVNRTIQGAAREYLVIEYAPSKRGQPGDRLFVPMDQLDLVSRYVGGESPSLDKLGGADWTARKNKARKAVRQIAGELIKLYAARQSTKGHAFGPDTPWQAELEDAFAFVETPDQLITIDEVKRDMERQVPMDRLVCGDVGYGKTEIAVRAAFKAIQDGKQVILLVPTTLLVQQHYATFAERFGQFPVTIKPLSRFQTEKESQATLDGLADGSVDLVVGTHRLLQPGVRIKDLGLVIVDEEQRFGVEHKEALKHLRAAVDVLAMSATPIPRTLEMAVTGIREMSTIATPPEERHPVLSFVGAYDDKQVAAAIRRELLREGQAFFIHNRVQSIDKVVRRLGELVPEARIAAAHGQMGEHQLEKVMVDFWEKRYDVLVCTTIVESGLDVSNANTMIIERSDTLGLSQLHQLRGRVGRGRERAYAYFLYPPDKPLTETAHDRLATIAQHSELGGGMQVAMKDLEIRGAGNLLGGEQSGHIADVGFDLYVRLVGEAVAEFRGEGEAGPQGAREVKLELPVEAHLPHDYVPSERLRLEMYKRLADVRSLDDVAELRAELVDRYGEPPEVAEVLLDVARLRVAVRAAGLTEVTSAGSQIRFGGLSLPESAQMRLRRVYPKSIYKPATDVALVPAPRTAPVGGRPLRGRELLEWVDTVVQTLVA